MNNNQVQSAFRHKVKWVKYGLLISIIGVALILFGTVGEISSKNDEFEF